MHRERPWRRGKRLSADRGHQRYTEFLTGSELEHAQGIIDDLIGSILTSIKPSFEVANLEGDAVFAYAPATTLPLGPTTLDVIDSAYAAFIGTREHIQRNTNCPCQACSNITALDLKFVAHFGSYVRSRYGAREELTGPDVVLVHRLLKNSIVETTQMQAYAFVTDTCLAALQAIPAGEEGVAHSESYEHFELVTGRVFDLRRAFESRPRDEVHVRPEQTWVETSCETALPVTRAWEHVTNPNLRRVWLEADAITEDGAPGGRRGVGSVQHCHHGKNVFRHTILDWDPCRRVTMESSLPLGGRFRFEIELTETGRGGTQVRCRFGPVVGSNAFHTVALRVLMRLLRVRRGLLRGGDLLEQALRAAEDEPVGV